MKSYYTDNKIVLYKKNERKRKLFFYRNNKSLEPAPHGPIPVQWDPAVRTQAGFNEKLLMEHLLSATARAAARCKVTHSV